MNTKYFTRQSMRDILRCIIDRQVMLYENLEMITEGDVLKKCLSILDIQVEEKLSDISEIPYTKAEALDIIRFIRDDNMANDVINGKVSIDGNSLEDTILNAYSGHKKSKSLVARYTSTPSNPEQLVYIRDCRMLAIQEATKLVIAKGISSKGISSKGIPLDYDYIDATLEAAKRLYKWLMEDTIVKSTNR